MENAMGTATTTTTPESAVEALMKQVADENGLEITENLEGESQNLRLGYICIYIHFSDKIILQT